MSADNDNIVSESEGHSENESRNESTSTSGTSHFSTSEGKPPAGEIITPETHQPEDLKTIHFAEGASAPSHWTLLGCIRSLFGGNK